MGILSLACLLLSVAVFEAAGQETPTQQALRLAQQLGSTDQCLFQSQECGNRGGSCSCTSTSDIIIIIIIKKRQSRRRMGRNCFCSQPPIVVSNPQINSFTTPCGFFANGRQRFCHNRCQFCSRGRFQQCVRTNRAGCLELGFDEPTETTEEKQAKIPEITKVEPNENAPVKTFTDTDNDDIKIPEKVDGVTGVEMVKPKDIMEDEIEKLAEVAEKALEEGIKKSSLPLIEQAKKNMKAIKDVVKNMQNDEVETGNNNSVEETKKMMKEIEKKEDAKTDNDELKPEVNPTVGSGNQMMNNNNNNNNNNNGMRI